MDTKQSSSCFKFMSLNKLLNWFLISTSLILIHCSNYSSGGNGSFLFSLLSKPVDTYQGCVSGCLNPNLTVGYLLEGRHVSGNVYFEDESELFPPWSNFTLFKIGQRFATDNIGAIGMSHLFALIFDNFMPDVKDILLATGSTSTRERASKRYTATAAQVVIWYQHSIDIPSERRILLKSLEQVRRRHIDASLKVLQKFKDKDYLEKHRRTMMKRLEQDKTSVYNDFRFWSAFKYDLETSRIPPRQRKYPTYKYGNVPISQFGHAMTQWSFAAMVILYRKQLGIKHVTEEELRGFIHVWAVLGHALGVHDEYNICMQASLEESTKLFRDLLEGIMIPGVFHMDETSHVLVSAYLDSLSELHPMITPGLMGYKFLRDMMQVRPVRMQNYLNIVERFSLAGLDGLMSDNLMFNKWFTNINGAFSLDVNGYRYFGRNYSTTDTRSEHAFYTQEKVSI